MNNTSQDSEMVSNQEFINKLESSSMNPQQRKIVMIALAVVLVLGIGTGYVLAASGKSSVILAPENTQQTASESQVKVGQVFGAKDRAFKDPVEGIVLLGGLNGEGSHHLVREGGESQTVYLTSSIVDLSLFENHKVKVWGETFKAQKAGWLMDAGRIEVIELNSILPDWALPKVPNNQKNVD